jgi:hypothetical protein
MKGWDLTGSFLIGLLIAFLLRVFKQAIAIHTP